MKSILITGGSGSFGTAFTKRLLEGTEYGRICIYSRNEHRQAEMRQEFNNDPRLRFFIGDIRDRWRLTWACDGIDTLVHAAALKRVEVGFYNPEEMMETNYGGARNVIAAARDKGIKKVVALSTDKAFEPKERNTYGISKAAAECIFLAAGITVTRYGNVWGSAGSVIPIWRALLRSGARVVPVTDPECTRFFMLMREAIDLVNKAIGLPGGQLVIPELPAYRVGDVPRALGVGQEVIGLPKFEKQHESMCEGRCSKDARRMSVDELRSHL